MTAPQPKCICIDMAPLVDELRGRQRVMAGILAVLLAETGRALPEGLLPAGTGPVQATPPPGRTPLTLIPGGAR